MEEEERWQKALRTLYVFPLAVCFLLFVVLIGFGNAKDIFLILISLFCIVSYFLIYFIQIKKQKSTKIALFLALNLICSTFWSAIFFAFWFERVMNFEIGFMLLCSIIVYYPLIMLYYNFRLFMNEISKPSWHADDADVPPQIVTDFYS